MCGVHRLSSILRLPIRAMRFFRPFGRRPTGNLRCPSARHGVGFVCGSSGPLCQPFEVLDADRQEALERDPTSLAGRYNRSGEETMVVPGDYLEAAALRG